ncbi:phosphotransferase [Nocardia sp. NPDC101769]|uniref:phosphotransferase n=1 Tax=Nocardia sp. NPDC101769 TaxID=3364333 RepID=UPI003810390B
MRLRLPPRVAELLGPNPAWSDDHEGRSGGVVRANGTYWVKRGAVAVAEFPRYRWLAERSMAVPEIAVFEDDMLVLVDAGVPSVASVQPDSPGALMGETLRRLHALPVAGCPFDARLDITLAEAYRLLVEGLVDVDDFDEDNLGRTAEQVYEQLVAERPDTEDLVVAHGDYTPSNVLAGGILIDVGRLGVADRYRDLALAARDLADDFGVGEVEAFFAAYSLPDPDPARLAYYRLLDELF